MSGKETARDDFVISLYNHKDNSSSNSKNDNSKHGNVFVLLNHNLRYAFDWYNSLRMHTKAI